MQKSAEFFLPDFSKVDLARFIRAIKCPVVGKPLQYSIQHHKFFCIS